ncbi:MAG: type IV pilus secretin PilQ, partial [Bdellovibrionota bacterium]
AAPNQQAPAAAATAGATAPPDRSKSNLDEFMQTMETKRFTGRPITLQLRDADLMDVFRLIGDTSGFNIVIGDDVKGKITLSLNDVPWDQALDMILHTQHLGAERNHNLLRIATLSSLTQEKQQELAATLAAQTSAPRVTRVFPISYANLGDLTTILTKFGGVATNSAGQSNIVQSDSRTNSIIVRDTPENIERMKRLIELLDTQTPQVLVESKIIEATEGFTRSVGGNLGLGFVPSATDGIPIQATTSFAGGNPVDQLIGSPGVFSTGASSASGGNGGNMGFSFGISPGIRLNAILNFAEHEENIKVITTPKTVVLNKQSASILQSQPVVINVTTTIPGGGSTQTPTTLNANINLTVTPTVTNEGSVLMDLNVERDVPQAQSVASRNIKTQVLVESGATLVIGGIYTLQNNKTSDGFPFLHKIPILGWLFGSDSDATSRSELMIFVTPRILNPKEAGLTS